LSSPTHICTFAGLDRSGRPPVDRRIAALIGHMALWRDTEVSAHVHAVVSCARTMSRRLGWLATVGQAAD
jgi:hypothetical protein